MSTCTYAWIEIGKWRLRIFLISFFSVYVVVLSVWLDLGSQAAFSTAWNQSKCVIAMQGFCSMSSFQLCTHSHA